MKSSAGSEIAKPRLTITIMITLCFTVKLLRSLTLQFLYERRTTKSKALSTYHFQPVLLHTPLNSLPPATVSVTQC